MPLNSDNYQVDLEALDHRQLMNSMLRDNAQRALGGTFIYPVLWLVIGLASGWYEHQQTQFLSNLTFLILISCLRLWVLAKTPSWIDKKPLLARAGCATVVLLNALHWGLISAVGVYDDSWEAIQTPLLLSAAGVAAAGTAVLAIDPYIRFLFPSFVLLPVVGVLLLDLTSTNILIAILCLVFVVYLTVASKSVNQDYWKALQTSMLLEKKAAEFRKLSVTDPLTQLHNRLYFDEQFQSEWRRASRCGQAISICLIDLDHFKQINDTYGHTFGDFCLIHAASVLDSQVRRAGDVVARYGGEEFIVLLPNTNGEGAQIFANKIRRAIKSEELVQGQHKTVLHASIGVASTRSGDLEAAHTLINHADKALYRAKAQGRDKVEVYED